MADRTKLEEKRAHARQLYVRNGLQQGEIAKLCQVSAKTISKWKIAEAWDKQRAAIVTTKEQQLARLYTMLNAITTAVGARPEAEQVPSAKEADSINKLASAIQKLEGEAGLSVKVSAYMDLLNFIRTKDLKAAQQFSDLADQYIHNLLS